MGRCRVGDKSKVLAGSRKEETGNDMCGKWAYTSLYEGRQGIAAEFSYDMYICIYHSMVADPVIPHNSFSLINYIM